jgi:capsular polysaccharide biosynthesis protein
VVSRTRRRQLLGEAFAVITLAVLVMPWVISLYQTPTYEATVKMLVSHKSQENCFREVCLLSTYASEDGGDPQDVTLTVAKVAETMPVAKAVVEQLNLPA